MEENCLQALWEDTPRFQPLNILDVLDKCDFSLIHLLLLRFSFLWVFYSFDQYRRAKGSWLRLYWTRHSLQAKINGLVPTPRLSTFSRHLPQRLLSKLTALQFELCLDLSCFLETRVLVLLLSVLQAFLDYLQLRTGSSLIHLNLKNLQFLYLGLFLWGWPTIWRSELSDHRSVTRLYQFCAGKGSKALHR